MLQNVRRVVPRRRRRVIQEESTALFEDRHGKDKRQVDISTVPEVDIQHEQQVTKPKCVSLKRPRHKLRKTVEGNQKSHEKLTPKKQLETCCICLEEIQISCESKLDSCSHTYCFPCIEKWVKDMENSCPQCKQKIHKITHLDVLGREKSLQVEDKVQEVDHFEDMYCEVCVERVYERNFDVRQRDQDTAAICEECMERAIHLRCMDEEGLAEWEEDRIYLCQECIDEMSDSELESESEFT